MMRNRIGLALIVAYLIYQIIPLQPELLEELQETRAYKNWSGFSLFLLVLCQWSVSVYRGIYNASGKSLEKAYTIHYWIGSLSPLVFFLHSPKPQYGMLLLLMMLFFGNSLLGILLQYKGLFGLARIKQAGIALHVLLSSLIFALILIHMRTVFLFN